MHIYDITQELLSSVVFPGDPAPQATSLCRIERGDLYNLSTLSMCAHNGTHVDAPAHFIRDGKTVDQIPPETFIGRCYVAHHTGDVTAADAQAMLTRARAAHAETRLLIAGKATVTEEAARVFADAPLCLIGNESQTVGPEHAPMAVHLLLLGRGIVLLEGVRLQHVPEGAYLLSAAPLNVAGLEGSPCRAVLIDLEQ